VSGVVSVLAMERTAMGQELVCEALDYAPDSLSWRELCALVVLADAAADSSRECPPGIEEQPEVIRRLRLSRTQRYVVISALVDKGALLRIERGRNGVRAAYSIAIHAPVKGPGNRDASPVPEPVGSGDKPVDNPVKGPGNRDASDPVKGPGFRDASDREGSRFTGRKGPGFQDATGEHTDLFKDDLKDDLISRAHAGAREAIRAAVPGVTDDEIDETIRIIKVRYNPRNTEKYIGRMIAAGDLEAHIPCGLGDKKHSDSCRSRNCKDCRWSWCEGRCHGSRGSSVQPRGMSA
jgi:hypothetical protein